ncbi:DUF1934 domain-containing protein [Anaerotalea alkaliphila]|uniref:DUF1934 domain-containing protein n=1 Tax=Anaerotalea alkaliphila TaxID=2662126 RepID=A0A7X5HVK9_9FIRM|nr:DUF1934 domain-containing protein [Anaerotalea alkaliphila]NDL67378.1 DUF1934 domain-containing protein [Anaerotalea alkaliphila]
MDERKVRISIKGMQSGLGDSGQEERLEMVVIGKSYEKNGKTYIVFDDLELDREKPTKTTVKVEAGLVSVLRFGAASTHLLFKEGEQHIAPYETPMGMLEILSKTRSVDFRKTDRGIDLKVVYYLEVNQMSMGNSTFSMVAEYI